MEKHLNLFYSYNQGNLGSSERIKQLEDNLTRALIVILKSLDNSLQIEFLKELLSRKKINSKSFVYDLQNTSNYIKKSENHRFLVILQRDKSSLSLEDIQEIETIFLENKTEKEKKNLEREIKTHLKSKTDNEFILENEKVNRSELNSILQFLYGNRPDAWIIGEKESVLIEAKIGNNSVSKYQIYRHVTGKNGFKINLSQLKKNEANLSIINITWEDICNIFAHIKTKANETEQFLISEFTKYISMTGQKLNLDYIINGEFDGDIHREQFSLFLTQFDSKLQQLGLPFERQNRPKADLWEVFGIRNEKDEYQKTHIIQLDSETMGLVFP